MKITKKNIPLLLAASTCLSACSKNITFEEASKYIDKFQEKLETIDKFKYVETEYRNNKETKKTEFLIDASKCYMLEVVTETRGYWYENEFGEWVAGDKVPFKDINLIYGKNNSIYTCTATYKDGVLEKSSCEETKDMHLKSEFDLYLHSRKGIYLSYDLLESDEHSTYEYQMNSLSNELIITWKRSLFDKNIKDKITFKYYQITNKVETHNKTNGDTYKVNTTITYSGFKYNYYSDIFKI